MKMEFFVVPALDPGDAGYHLLSGFSRLRSSSPGLVGPGGCAAWYGVGHRPKRSGNLNIRKAVPHPNGRRTTDPHPGINARAMRAKTAKAAWERYLRSVKPFVCWFP